MAGVGAASGMMMGVTPAPASTAGGFGDEALAEEARIAADEHAVGLGLGLDVGGDAGDGQADVGYGEFIGNNCAPTGGAKFDCCAHGFYFPPWAEATVKRVHDGANSE